MQIQSASRSTSPNIVADSDTADQSENYQTGRGCLTLSLMLLGAVALAVAAILIFGTPPA